MKNHHPARRRSSRNCRPSPAPRRPAAPCRRSRASSSRPPRGGIELRATDMEIGLRVPLEGEVVREGAVVLPARLLVDVIRSLPGDEVVARAAQRRAGRRDRRGRGDVPHPHAAARGLPAVPRAGGRRPRARSRARRSSPRSTRWPARPRATRRARCSPASSCRPPATSCGWSRPTPTASRSRRRSSRRRSRARSRPTCRRARCRSSRGSSAGRRGGRAQRRRADEPGDLRGRRRGALVAPDRRPVPQPPPAAAGRVRARAPARGRARSPTSCGASRCSRRRTRRCGSRSREGELTVSARTPGRRRGARDAARPVPRRAAGDRLQPGVPARRAGGGGVGRRAAEAHLAAAARADRGGGRQRVRLPPDADPPQRVGARRARHAPHACATSAATRPRRSRSGRG